MTTTAIRFTDRALALSFASRCHKMHVVMLGDDAEYWVVNMVDAARLERAGYEFAY